MAARIHFADDPTNPESAGAPEMALHRQEIDWISAPPGLDKVTRARPDPLLYLGPRACPIAATRTDRDLCESICRRRSRPAAGDQPHRRRLQSGRQDQADDFVSPDGEKGIDNNLYRAWGCDAPWRGNGNATLDLRANDKMQEGLYTMVIRISGNKDPMNDDDAVVEIGYSPDKIVKDARNGVAVDYSYRILQTAQYTRLKAKIRNGVVETEQVEHLHSPRIAWFYDQTGDANFTKGKLRLTIAPDGLSATGLIGGYRNWRDLYAENTFAQDGGAAGHPRA